MIEFTEERISHELEKRMRLWIVRPECATLIKVVTAKCQIKQAEALKRAMSAVDADAPEAKLSAEILKDARKYDAFLQVLNEVIEQSEAFTSVKLKPPNEIQPAEPTESPDDGEP